MPLARIILKAQTGIPLNERFTRFMKQRSSEEAALSKQHNDSPPQQIRSSDKNRRLALDLEKRHNDLDNRNASHRPIIRDSRNLDSRRDDRDARDARSSRDIRDSRDARNSRDARDSRRSRSPRARSNGNVRDRLGNGMNNKDSSVKDRLGKKSVKDRVELPVQTMADRLGSKPMHERIEFDKKPRITYTNLSPKKFTPKFQTRNGGNFNNKGKTENRTNNFRKSGPAPDQDTLDKEMDDYMKKSKAGLDSMLDDYMKGAPGKKATDNEIQNGSAAVENGAAE